jgi:hypothetical protein
VRAALAAEFEGAAPPAAVTQVSELRGWACCAVPHMRSRTAVTGHPELELEAISGEGPDTPSRTLPKREVATGLSTIWLLWRGSELVAKALMTYRNADVRVFGPAIELIGVKMCRRGQGLGLLLHKAIETELLRPKVGRMPSDSRIGLQAVYVTGYHRFFEKLGYLWSEETADGKSNMADAMAAVMGGMPGGGGSLNAQDMARFVESPGVTGRRNEDGILPLFRTSACAACGAAAGPEQPALKLLWCSQCRCTQFCSPACQRAAWPVHKQDCRKLGRVFKAAPPR